MIIHVSIFDMVNSIQTVNNITVVLTRLQNEILKNLI
jgi:hypothetical protein